MIFYLYSAATNIEKLTAVHKNNIIIQRQIKNPLNPFRPSRGARPPAYHVSSRPGLSLSERCQHRTCRSKSCIHRPVLLIISTSEDRLTSDSSSFFFLLLSSLSFFITSLISGVSSSLELSDSVPGAVAIFTDAVYKNRPDS